MRKNRPTTTGPVESARMPLDWLNALADPANDFAQNILPEGLYFAMYVSPVAMQLIVFPSNNRLPTKPPET